MRNAWILCMLSIGGCGSSPPPEPQTVDNEPHGEAVVPPPMPPQVEDPVYVPPPPPPPAPVVCEAFEHTLRRGGGFVGHRVEIATGTWEPGHAPQPLSRADAEAAGATETDAGALERTMPIDEHTQLFLQYEDDRAVGARVTRGHTSYVYQFLYDCAGAPVIDASGLVSRCRVTDGPALSCPGQEAVACAEISRGDFTDAEGEEILYGCMGDCAGVSENHRRAHVIVAGGAPVWAIETGEQTACQTATVVPNRRGLARVRFEGGGEDGSFNTEWTFQSGAMTMSRGRFTD